MAKRKHTAVEEQPPNGRANASAKAQKRMKSFGNVIKANNDEIVLEAKKMQQSPDPHLQAAPAVQAMPKPDKKRKRNAELAVEEIGASTNPQGHQPPTPSTPRSKRSRNTIPPSPARSAAALFDRLNINTHTSFAPSNPSSHSYRTPPATPEKDDISAIQHLCSLYSSFLSAISLHYSHNGASSPVSVHVLLPAITKHWQKRSVSLDDMRLLLAVEKHAGSAFALEDYGRAGICLRRIECRHSSKPIAGRINEEAMNTQFGIALQRCWQEWKATTDTVSRTIEAFLEQIPLSSIPKNESSEKASSLFARGQDRLADLKANSAAAQATTASRLAQLPAASQPKPQTTTTTTRGAALLNRVLARQTLASTLPTGPTRAQLERRAALDRIEDIQRVLCLLAGAKERVSFSMAVATQHLQQSLRSPINSAEAQRCLALMATEIVPEFLKIVMSEGVHGVVVTRSGHVGPSELRARLEKANV